MQFARPDNIMNNTLKGLTQDFIEYHQLFQALTAMPWVHELPTEPITGLSFREPTEDNLNIYLFVVTTNHVLSYQASGKGSGGAVLWWMKSAVPWVARQLIGMPRTLL